MATYKCPLCLVSSPTLRLHVSHLRITHTKEDSFRVLCGVNDCREVFHTFSAFNSHIYRHHRTEVGIGQLAGVESHCSILPGQEVRSDVIPLDISRCLESGADVNDRDGGMHSSENFVMTQDTFVTTLSTRYNAVPSDPSLVAAEMLLQLREGHQVSQVALTDVVSGCRSICSQALNMLRRDVIAALGSSNEAASTIAHINLEDYDQFKNIDTNYLFEKYCIDHLGCLEAEEIAFGEPYYTHKYTANVHRKVSQTDKFYYVSILNTLQKLMKLEDYQAEILNMHASTSYLLTDFCDGSLFKGHPLFSIDHNAFQIVGYYDDLEVVNPLGSYVQKHKLGCLFFFLGNIRPQFRSTLKTIHLVAVGRTEDIQHYGINSFLTPFVEDLKRLYLDGLTVNIGDNQVTMHGALIAFLADTLAAHAIGGFKGSMSFALRVCRTCMVTSDQIQECFSESFCVLRTAESHFEQCSLLDGPLQSHYSTTYGVNFMSVLEEVPGFSIINGLPHDIMHDLYEGIVPYELKLLLRHCLNSMYFTLDELNGRIERYGFNCNEPRLLDISVIRSRESKIRQSASQMMSLSHNLPLIIGDKIPEDDRHWVSFLLLLRICQISNSPICSPDTVCYLRVLIEEKLHTFKMVYPNDKLRPKHHYMLHYPAQIERLGPLIQCWTMRQESKLNFVKNVSRLSNYKNICKTVAKKHNMWMCYQFIKNPHLFTPSVSYSTKYTSQPLCSEDDYIQAEFFTLIPNLSLESEIKHYSWIRVQSSTIRKGTFVLVKYDVESPVFGKVIDILCYISTILLYVQEYIGDVFCSHFNAFLVKSHGKFNILNMDTIPDHRPLTVRSPFASSGDLYALMPYYY